MSGFSMKDLEKIKKLLLHGRFRFSDHAKSSLFLDGLSQEDAVISILNAQSYYKRQRDEDSYKYTFISPTFDNVWIYSVGKIILEDDKEPSYYFYITTHRSD